MPVHGIDNGNNKHEVYTTEELLSILQQAINSGSLQGIDPTQTPIVAAVRESHNNSDVTFWSGTEAEFNELTGVTSELVGARIGSDGKLYILTGDTTLSDTVEAARQAALEATEGMKREVISVTLPASGWSNTAPYTQTVAVAGMTEDKDFLAPYVVPTGNESDDLAAQVALSCISGGTTDTDAVTFYCYDEKPTTTITVYMVDKGTKIEPGGYPIASRTAPGIMKVGDGLNVDENGVVSTEMQADDYYTNDETDSLLAKRVRYYSITPSSTAEEIDAAFSDTSASIINFANGTYTFTKVYEINSNTTVLLNNAEVHAKANSRLFYVFNTLGVDVTGYSGVHNVKIIGGKVDSCISMIHCMNVEIRDVHFYHGICDHFMEICASKDIVVDKCKFEGVVTQSSSRQYVENVQIENANYTNFPWLPDGSAAFDNLGCDGVEIKNCEFIQPDVDTHWLYSAIGGHTVTADYPHSNISIHDNSIVDTISESIRLLNTTNVEIYNNILKESNVLNPDGNDVNCISMRTKTTKCYIHDNVIDGFSGIQISIVDGSSDVKIVGNTFKNLPKLVVDESTESNAITCGRVENLVIDSNHFVNVLGGILWNVAGGTGEACDITFSNNIIESPSTSTDLYYYRTRFYSCDNLVFKDNVFNENPASGRLIRLHSSDGSIFISGNRAIQSFDIIDKNGYTGSFANVYGVMVRGWSGNTSNITDTELNYPYNEFNKAILIYGDGAQTNAITIKAFAPYGKLDERSCVYPTCHQSDGAIAMGKITFASDNKVTTTGGNVNLRTIYLMNE